VSFVGRRQPLARTPNTVGANLLGRTNRNPRQSFARASHTINALLRHHFECDPCQSFADASNTISTPLRHHFECDPHRPLAITSNSVSANRSQALRRRSVTSSVVGDSSSQALRIRPARTLRTDAAMYLRAAACRSISGTPHTVNANLPQALHADSAVPHAFGD
jgi:hypothetical protein